MIRRLAAEGVPKAVIARRLGISRTTVVKAVASSAPPRYERSPTESSFLLGKVAQRHGLPQESLTMRTLNAESSETGIRRLASEWLQDSYCLDLLVRERILTMAQEIQDVLGAFAEDRSSLDGIRPAVEPVEPDP